MYYLELLAYYHWLVISIGCLLLVIAGLRGIALPATVAALLLAAVTYLFPDIPWGWQMWAFVMVTALASIIYLRLQQDTREEADPLAGKATQSSVDAAADLVGTTLALDEPMVAGFGKLRINHEYWKVSTRRNYPAGTVVTVVASKADVLELEPAAKTRRDAPAAAHAGEVPFADYTRDRRVERDYGAPDFDMWVLFYNARQSHSMLSLVQAYHFICGLAGKSLEQAKRTLNTDTLALYDPQAEGEYLITRTNIYCEPRTYGFLYGEGTWSGTDDARFAEEMDKLAAALKTAWAEQLRGDMAPQMIQTGLRMLREGRLAAAGSAPGQPGQS